jgi:transcriptional regulator of acetoin/glycerol metabolism
LPSNLQSHLIEKKSQYLMAAAGAGSYGPLPESGESTATLAPVPAVVPLAELERRAILNALEYTRGDRAVAAHLLGIGRTTLYRKLKEYQLVS